MDVIPVIDLKGGVVVHARGGKRNCYQPIVTPLAGTSAPLDVVRGLLSVHPFSTFYIADLDAIAAEGDNRPIVQHLRRELPSLRLWVDSGIADQNAVVSWRAADLGDLVLGSEAQIDCALVHQSGADSDVVLSLDFRGDVFQGPQDLLAQPVRWPHRVIVMTLARVGSGAGPDLERLRDIGKQAGGRAVYAAGGVRDASDLAALARAGMAGALVATSLHDGRLRGADIAELRFLGIAPSY